MPSDTPSEIDLPPMTLPQPAITLPQPRPVATATDMLNRHVVLDTAGAILYLGTLREVRPDGFALEDADVHDCREGHANKELYVCEAAREGIRSNRQRVFVFRESVMSISLLEDVVSG